MTLRERRRDERNNPGLSARGDDRRDWPRREVSIEVREADGAWHTCQGDLSVEGAAFVSSSPPVGDLVSLRFTVPTFEGPMVASAKVLSRIGRWQDTHVSVQFVDLQVEAQLALASWFHSLATSTIRFTGSVAAPE